MQFAIAEESSQLEPEKTSSFTEPSTKRPRVSQDDDIEKVPPAPVVKQELSVPSNQYQSNQQEDSKLAGTYDEDSEKERVSR